MRVSHTGILFVVMVTSSLFGQCECPETASIIDFESGLISGDIVGVVSDTRNRGPLNPVTPAYYRPLSQPGRFQGDGMVLVVRSAGALGQAVAEAQRLAWSVRTDLPFYRLRMEADISSGFASETRFLLILLVSFATLAMVLAAVGIYGVTTFVLARRTRELGIRRAIGAAPGGIVSMVLKETMAFAGVGVAVGVVLAASSGPLVQSFLFEVAPSSPAVLSGAALLVLAIAGLAALLPARRAARLDPMRSIQVE